MPKHPSPIERAGALRERRADEPRAGEQALDAQPSASQDRLSASDRELLAAARRQLQQQAVPGPVQQRLFERVMHEAQRIEPKPASPAPLVPVRARGVWLALGSAAAMAAGLVLLASARPLFRGGSGDEPVAGGDRPRPEQRLGERIFQSALFHAPAPEWSGALPPADSSLFGERPFSRQSRAWQVRYWNDLRADPGEPAKHDFDEGALCITLRSGERVIGAWPWLPNGSDAPAPVALAAGRAYRLVFKAWASDPLPSQLLVAVGHAQLPFSAAAGARVEVSTTPEPFVVSFIAQHDDPSAGVAFLANTGDGAEPPRVCLSDVTLTERPR
jgi:hypothetical protein